MAGRRLLLLYALLLAAPGLALAQAASGGGSGEQHPRPGDRVVLRIWNEPEMSDTFTVAQNGEVILPRLGSVRVDDQGISALERSLRDQYATYLRNPSVEVTVLRRVSVIGEVRNPGIYMADLTMTLPDVIARAGGPTEAGNPNRITIVRGTQRLRFGARDQELMQVSQLESGDQVIVGRRNSFARNPLATVTSLMGVAGFVLTVVLPSIRN